MQKALSTRLFGFSGFHWRGSFGVFILAPAGMLALCSRPLPALGSWLDLILELTAWIVFFLGLLFRIWATLYIGARKTRILVMEGPFSMCRNPLYLGSFLVAASGALFLKSLTFMAALCLLVIFYMWATIPEEEKELRAIHDRAYEEYCRRVPRYWPQFSQLCSPETIEVKIQGLRIEGKRLLVWIWLPALGTLLNHLREQPWWPNLLVIP